MKKLSNIPPKAFGALVMLLFVVVGLATFQKEKLDTLFTFGHENMAAEFTNRSKLIGDDLTYDHTVKLNGVVVGKVTTIEQTDHDTMIAHMLVDPGTREKLGSAPSAFIRPTLVTDGVQFLGLETGGDPGQEFTGDLIPLQRTRVPVFLDDVLKSLSAESAQRGTRAFIQQTESLFRSGGSEAVRTLVTDAPATLRPAGTVLTAFRGTNPDSDLTELVQGFESFSQALNQQQGQFESSVRSLNGTMAALSAGSQPLATAIASGPETLRVSQAGFADLRPALGKLRKTSEDFRPSARKLSDFLDDFAPVLHRTVPVLRDLRDVADDARPMLNKLVPSADVGTEVLDDIGGDVFDRINGPIKDRIYSNFVGKNEYKGGSIPVPTYKSLAYLLSSSSNVWKHYDSNIAIARLEAGGGGQSIGGSKFPKSMQEYLETFGLGQPAGPNNPADGPLGRFEPKKFQPQKAAPDLSHPNSDLPLLGGTR